MSEIRGGLSHSASGERKYPGRLGQCLVQCVLNNLRFELV